MLLVRIEFEFFSFQFLLQDGVMLLHLCFVLIEDQDVIGIAEIRDIRFFEQPVQTAEIEIGEEAGQRDTGHGAALFADRFPVPDAPVFTKQFFKKSEKHRIIFKHFFQHFQKLRHIDRIEIVPDIELDHGPAVYVRDLPNAVESGLGCDAAAERITAVRQLAVIAVEQPGEQFQDPGLGSIETVNGAFFV